MSLIVKSRPLLFTLCLWVAASATAQTLVPRGSSWKYHNLGQNLFTTQPTWNQRSHDDSEFNGWSTNAPAPLGFNLQNSIQYCTTAIDIGPADPRHPVIFYRHSFTVSVNIYQGLILRVQADDSAAIYLNGSLLHNDAVPAAALGAFAYGGRGADLPDEILYREFTVSATGLVAGVNVLAVENHNSAANSSDLQFDLEVEGIVDNVAPTAVYDPIPGSVVLGLNSINVLFSESVIGISASDLLINDQPATNMVTLNPNDFTFFFATPPTGTVHVAWAANHGITDSAPLANPFAGGEWTYTYDPNASPRPDIIITEFMALNDNGIRDEQGFRRDWIELYNAGPLAANLEGFFLTDTKENLARWRFPSVTLGANNYLIVWASGNDRRTLPLHTDFRLQASGGYLALVDPDTNVVSEFDPFPEQSSDVSYGRVAGEPTQVGFFAVPTPGAQNSTSGTGFLRELVFSLATGIYTNDSLTLTISSPDGGQIRYTQDGTIPTAASTLYVSPISFNANRTFKARAFPAGGSGLFPSPVGARTFIMLDNSTRDFNSNLPILILSTEGRAINFDLPPGSANRTKGGFVVIDTKYGQASLRDDPQFHGLAGYEVTGQSSRDWPKRAHRIEIHDALFNDRSVGLLGMPADADWRLRNPYADKCLMNDFLAFEMFEEMGHYSVRRRFVEAFVDTGGGKLSYPLDYHGVMVLVENIEVNEDRLNIAKLTPAHTNEPAITGGWVLKYDKDSPGDIEIQTRGGGGFVGLGSPTQVGRGLKIHEPRPHELGTIQTPTTMFSNLTASAQIQVRWLTNWLQRMEGSMYATTWRTAMGTNHWSHYIDADTWVDQHWIVEFPKQIDGYRLSNYMHKDRNGKLKMSPIWDWNLSFGNSYYLSGGRTNGWYYELASEPDHPWLRRLITGTPGPTGNVGDPDFNQKIADRWGVLRTNVMNGERVLKRIDEIADLLTVGGASTRNFTKYNYLGTYQWPNPPGNPIGDQGPHHVNYWVGISNYSQIISEMKNWTYGRYLWIETNFTVPPTLSASDGPVTNGYILNIAGPPGAAVYYTLDGTDPRGWYDPATGTGTPGSTNGALYTGPITINGNARVVARARQLGKWKNTWSGPVAASLYAAIPALRVTEIMYHPQDPPQPSNYGDEDFEFIELRNVSGSSLNITGYRLRGGIDFVFPNITLAAGQRVLVVNNLLAFSALYNTNGMIIAGEFAGDNNLDNTGERLIVEGRLGEPIQDFRYDDDWYKITDGMGFSLAIANDTLPAEAWNDPANWRIGGVLNGTPNAGEPSPVTFPQVVISEALTHTDELTALDAIELHNLGSTPADVSFWFLSDDRLVIKKFQIPEDTIIPPGGYISFDESQFNSGFNPFSLSSEGDEVYLASATELGELTGYLHGFSFEAQLNGVTFGRHVTSLQRERFVAQTANTVNGANAGPLVKNVIISEVHYHPQNVFANGAYWNNNDDEFIEIHNRGGVAVNLYHPGNPNHVWKLEKAAEFDFPPGTQIPAGGYIVLVNFNPLTKPAMAASFRSRFNVPAQVPLMGPLEGDLSNDEETVALYQPDLPVTNVNSQVTVPYVLVEEVGYGDETPWPLAADGAGLTLQRRMPAQYSDDPINWEAGTPTPGRGFTGGAIPTITAQPVNTSVLEGNPVSLNVNATGPQPLRYQWRKDGANLPGQTNSSMTLSRTIEGDAGNYQALVMNNSGYVTSVVVRLTVRIGVRFVQHPVSLTVRPPTNATFFVVATSPNPITYQWFFNGNPLVGETNSMLTINNVTNIHDGSYAVLCADVEGPVISQAAQLTVLIPPLMISPSPAAPLRITAVAGETVSLGAQLHGTLPIAARWRLTRTNAQSPILTPDTTNNLRFITKTLTVAPNDNNGRIILGLINSAGGSWGQTGFVTNALLTVLADTDGDGLPDVYEGAEGLDPNGDADNDQSSNRDEYIAGTDPRDPLSYLKVDRVELTGAAEVQFMGVSNRTYTVLYADDLSVGTPWQPLASFAPRQTNWNASTVDPSSPPRRFYRLVTPAQ